MEVRAHRGAPRRGLLREGPVRPRVGGLSLLVFFFLLGTIALVTPQAFAADARSAPWTSKAAAPRCQSAKAKEKQAKRRVKKAANQAKRAGAAVKKARSRTTMRRAKRSLRAARAAQRRAKQALKKATRVRRNACAVGPDPQVDLGLTLRTSVGSVSAGESFDYIFTITNHSYRKATGITVMDPLPSGVIFDSSSDCILLTESLTCDIRKLDARSQVSITATVIAVDPSGTHIENSAAVSGNQPDPNPTNNIAKVRTKITRTHEISVSDNYFMPANLEITAGDIVSWTWSNSASREGHDVSLTNAPPNVSAFEFVSPVLMGPDGSFQRRFTVPGEYTFICSLHIGQTMRVRVEP